jgi:hypothetical protein
MSDPRYIREENILPELTEECGKVIQECSKIIQAGGKMLRCDNALDVRAACSNLERELDDLRAAIVRFKKIYNA